MSMYGNYRVRIKNDAFSATARESENTGQKQCSATSGTTEYVRSVRETIDKSAKRI